MRARLLLLSTFLLIGCTESYEGPLRDKPIQTEVDTQGRTKIITLWDKIMNEPIPDRPLNQAFDFFDQNRNLIHNRNWLTIIDFTRFSGEQRLWVLDLNTGNVDHLHVAHGQGSDPQDSGYARQFGNEVNSWMSSLGFYLISEPYHGRWGLSARLDGLSETNSRARERAVVLHGADYVGPHMEKMGLSQGCPAVDLKLIETLVNRLQGQSLMYAYIEGM